MEVNVPLQSVLPLSTYQQSVGSSEEFLEERATPSNYNVGRAVRFALESQFENEDNHENSQRTIRKIRKAYSYRRLRETAINGENEQWESLNDVAKHQEPSLSPKTYLRQVYHKIRVRTPYYIPILAWLPQYRWCRDFPSDLVAGFGVASLLIPQVNI